MAGEGSETQCPAWAAEGAAVAQLDERTKGALVRPHFCRHGAALPCSAAKATWQKVRHLLPEAAENYRMVFSSLTDVRNYLQLQSSGRREGQRARLISPTIYLPQSAVCMVFQYQAWGSNGVMLRVWREASQEQKALWVITEDQGEEWREGRIILPSYDMEYRVRCLQKVCWTR